MRRIRGRWIGPLALWVLLFGIALLLDRPAYRALLAPGTADEDWYQVLRQMGYLPTWLIVALLIWLHDRRHRPARNGLVAPLPDRPGHHRAGLVTLAVVLGGLTANILKPLIGRLRPDPDRLGVAAFAERPWILWGEQGELGLGLPSGHTATAFAGAGMVALLWPAWRWPVLTLAAGCGLTRMLAGAHTLSDVVAGAGVGLAIAWILYAAGEGPRRGPAGGLLTR